MNDHELKIELMRKYGSRIRTNFDFHIKGEIPSKKVDNALIKFAFGMDRHTMIGFYDTSLMGSGKAGYIFTDSSVYYLETLEKPKVIHYRDISRVQVKKSYESKDCNRELQINMYDGGKIVWTSIFLNKTPLCDFFNEMLFLIRSPSFTLDENDTISPHGSDNCTSPLHVSDLFDTSVDLPYPENENLENVIILGDGTNNASESSDINTMQQSDTSEPHKSNLNISNGEIDVDNPLQPGKLTYNHDRTFEVAVLSTMSSGKSTFINALIGKDLLPSRNQACTARTTAVLDNDEAQSVTGHVLFGDGTYQKVSDCTADQISDILENRKDKIADIVIECSIPEIRNIGRSLMIVDTPGANNVLDDTHGNTTRDYLQHLTSGLILYVLNATQIGTYDDTKLLKILKLAMEKSPNLSVYFILNKADSIDTKKESLDNIVELCNTYLNKQGFKNAQIYPVSAKAALIFRKALSGQTLSESEEIDFYIFFSKFKTTDFSLSRFYSRPEVCVVEEEEYLKRDILAAVENTGLPLIERAIEAKLIEQTIIKAPEIANPYNVSSKEEIKTENAPPKSTYDAFQKTMADLTRILSGATNSKK